MIPRFAVGAHQYDLTHANAGTDPQGAARDVAHLEDLTIRDTGLHERRRDMDHQAEPREAAAAFQKAAHIRRKRDRLARDPMDRDAGLENEAAFESFDGRVVTKVRLVVNLDRHPAHFDHADLVAQRQIDRRDADQYPQRRCRHGRRALPAPPGR